MHQEHRKHIALWVAVGGTMAVIVALWVLILPMQLQDSRFLGMRGAARWNGVHVEEGGNNGPSFGDVLAKQRRRLLDIEKKTGTSTQDATVKIQELRAKIEAANQKNEAPAAPAPAPAPAP